MQMNKEFKKYLIRFGLILLIVSPIIMFSQGTNALTIILYKICLVTIAVGLAEMIWMAFFKPVLGRMEAIAVNEKQGVLIFRGILYAAVILAITLGL